MSQDVETNETEVKMLHEPAGPSCALDVVENNEAVFDDNDERKIPMLLISPSNQKEDVPTEKTNECDEDCESFKPADLLTFAWQIARGMVTSQNYFFATLTLIIIFLLKYKF